jgi:cobalt-zinc-cadmium efflux system outer membrane protein
MARTLLLLAWWVAVPGMAPDGTAPVGVPVKKEVHRLRQHEAEALALSRNRQLIAARLQVQAAMVEQISASMLDNPEVAYTLNNVVLGEGYDQEMGIHPKHFEQVQHSVQLSQSLDLWFKRRKHKEVAKLGVWVSRLMVEDALRQVRYAVRSQFATVLREQAECRLAVDMRRRYDRTVDLSQKRFLAGDISHAEQDKIALEKLKYVNEEIEAHTELQNARQQLANLLAYPSSDALDLELDDEVPAPQSRDTDALYELALQARPDMQAQTLQRQRSVAAVAAAQRDGWVNPQLMVSYTRSYFQVSGDNPHALGLGISLPLPFFSRNQANIRAAQVELLEADNDLEALRLDVATQVRNAVAKVSGARAMLDVFETEMLSRADAALSVAERSYRVGATNYLELLEAQRTFLETRASFLKTQYDWRQSLIDVNFAVGTEP